jgi:predicted O-methyltransferase YrrM
VVSATETSYLPVWNTVDDLRKGRCVRDGYRRGWGLQCSDLSSKVLADPIYHQCAGLAHGRTIQTEMCRMNIYLILRFYLDKLDGGNIVEFGSYLGGSAIFMAAVCRALGIRSEVYALDTFEGMPATNPQIDAHGERDFGGVDLDELRSYAKQIGLSNLHLVKGRFEDTFGSVASAAPFRLAHIDCDIHSAVCFAYDAVKPLMLAGGYIIFDDATSASCIGATEAVEDLVIRRDNMNSEQIFPHFVFRALKL